MTLLGQAHREEKSNMKAAHKSTTQAVGLSYQRFCPSEAWTPAVNLYEDPEAYYLVMDLAGVKTSQIDVRVDNKGVMVITGTREMPEVTGAGNTMRLHLMEIDHGRFCRTVDLPEDTDVDSIDATYRSGYLWVRVSKK